MKPINHPDFVYTPWSAERRKAASERERQRIAEAKANGTYRRPPGKKKVRKR